MPAVEALVNPKETAQVAVRVFPERYPPGLMKEAMESVDATIAELKNQIGDMQAVGVAKVALELLTQMSRVAPGLIPS